MADHEAAAVHRRVVALYDEVLAGRLDEALALIDPDVIDHRGGTDGDFHGVDAWRAKWEALRSSDFGEFDVRIAHNVAAGDTSVNRYETAGTHLPTGHRYSVTGMDMVRVRDGRIYEHWALRDQAALAAQLGL